MPRDAADQVLLQACRVYRIAWNMLGNVSAARQATEQALLLLTRPPDRDGVPLYGIALDVILLRAGPTRRSGAGSLDFFLPRFDTQGCLASPPPGWPDPTDEALRRPDLADAVRGMLQRLEPIDRAAFVLREIEQMPLAEVVEILRLAAEEVRARTHRAALLLTGMLAGQVAAYRESGATGILLLDDGYERPVQGPFTSPHPHRASGDAAQAPEWEAAINAAAASVLRQDVPDAGIGPAARAPPDRGRPR